MEWIKKIIEKSGLTHRQVKWLGIALVASTVIAAALFIYFKVAKKNSKTLGSSLTYDQTLIDHLKDAEGFYNNAYQDPVGIWTVGVGHNLQADPAYNGADYSTVSLTDDQVNALLISDLDKVQNYLQDVLGGFYFTQGQWDALLDFAWGGIGAFQGSTLFKYVSGQLTPPNGDQSIADEFMKWNHATVNGVLTVLPGLTTRRQWESDHYLGNF